jgi:hypothetical protein
MGGRVRRATTALASAALAECGLSVVGSAEDRPGPGALADVASSRSADGGDDRIAEDGAASGDVDGAADVAGQDAACPTVPRRRSHHAFDGVGSARERLGGRERRRAHASDTR